MPNCESLLDTEVERKHVKRRRGERKVGIQGRRNGGKKKGRKERRKTMEG